MPDAAAAAPLSTAELLPAYGRAAGRRRVPLPGLLKSDSCVNQAPCERLALLVRHLCDKWR
jgi:hypothetical protein